MDYNDGDNDNEDYVEEYGIEDELNSDDDIDDLDDDFEEKVIVKKDNEEDLEEEDDDEEGEEEIDTKHYVEKEYKTKYDFITKYEMCRLIEGLSKIICNSNFNVHPDIPKDLVKIEDIAIYWLLNEKIPFPIDLVRKVNGRKSEVINIRRLKILKR